MTARTFFASAGSRSPTTSPSSPAGPPHGLPRRRASPRGIKPSGAPDLGLLVSTRPSTTSAARFTRSGTQAAPVLLCRERCRAGRAPRDRRQLRQRQRRHRPRRASRTRPRCRARPRSRRGRLRGPGRGRLDRRDRRAAADGHGDRGIVAAAHELARRRRRRVRRGDPDHRRVREARPPGGRRCSAGTVTAHRPGQGRRDDLAGLRDPAVLRAVRRGAVAETCDLLLAVCRQALFRADQRRRPAVDQRHRDPPVQRRVGRQGRPRDRGRAALRRGDRRGHAPAGAARSCATARVPGASAGWSCAAATRTRSARSRAPSPNSPLVKTALYGGDPNWGRIVQAAGAALPGHRAAAARHRDRGRAGVRARVTTCPTTRRRWRRRWRATRSSTRSACRARAPRPSCYFSDLGHEYVTINADYTT